MVAGGGGGGGIVHLLAPSGADTGTITVDGGAAGVTIGSLPPAGLRAGGGAGRSCGGAGGLRRQRQRLQTTLWKPVQVAPATCSRPWPIPPHFSERGGSAPPSR